MCNATRASNCFSQMFHLIKINQNNFLISENDHQLTQSIFTLTVTIRDKWDFWKKVTYSKTETLSNHGKPDSKIQWIRLVWIWIKFSDINMILNLADRIFAVQLFFHQNTIRHLIQIQHWIHQCNDWNGIQTRLWAHPISHPHGYMWSILDNTDQVKLAPHCIDGLR